jgi:hypothetical protein
MHPVNFFLKYYDMLTENLWLVIETTAGSRRPAAAAGAAAGADGDRRQRTRNVKKTVDQNLSRASAAGSGRSTHNHGPLGNIGVPSPPIWPRGMGSVPDKHHRMVNNSY